jgi:hypothetical protein
MFTRSPGAPEAILVWALGAEHALTHLGRELGPGLVCKKFCKIFQIPRHIEFLDTCMKH